MQGTLPNPKIAGRLSDLAVGLAADCDNPEPAIEKLMRSHLSNATGLPFVAILTADGRWVAGDSGITSDTSMTGLLDKAERSSLLAASAAVRKKLKGMLPRTRKAAAKGDWKTVVKSNQSAAKLRGLCPERTELRNLLRDARKWADTQFREVIRMGQTGGDLKAAAKKLSTVKRTFSGEPEAKDADVGIKALKKLEAVVKAEGGGERDEERRERTKEPFAKTRWASLFDEPDSEESEIDFG
ncbi:MAG: hypothetical protein AAGD14_03605 [Planctomycetota bacterium]